jgi:2,3-bisphosphoglycerate-independent phosphoglycerate mutase
MSDVRRVGNKQVCLVVLDGWGHSADPINNAIAAASTPNFDSLWAANPHTLIEASGAAVGLPDGQMGNSEVGHSTIGAGQAVETDLKRIGDAAKRDEFIANPAFDGAFRNVIRNDSTLHVLGLVGDGGVHAHGDYLHALLLAAEKAGVNDVAVHAFTDGRDSGTQEAASHLRALEQHLQVFENGRIASVSGRYFAMDRDQNFDRQSKAEAVILHGQTARDGLASQALSNAYLSGNSDELFEPLAFRDAGGQSTRITENDSVVFMNFRADRAIQLSERISKIPNVHFVTLTDYGPTVSAKVAFPPITVETTLAAEIDRAGLTQAHVAESEKGPHATYFLNGRRREPHPLERHEIIKSYNSSDGVDTHDKMPDMRAVEVARKTIGHITKGTNFVFANFANPDMVGHTANVPAIIRAVETTDRQLGLVARAALASGGVLLLTADHGNAELNLTPEGEPHTSHTTNPVPLVVLGKEPVLPLMTDGTLADLAPSVLRLFNIEQPASMTGRPLVLRKP